MGTLYLHVTYIHLRSGNIYIRLVYLTVSECCLILICCMFEASIYLQMEAFHCVPK